MSGSCPCVGGSPAACLTWGLAELCSFQLFSKQSKHVTDGGESCLKTPSEAGIECLGGVTAPWWAPLEKLVRWGEPSFLPKSLRLKDLPAPALQVSDPRPGASRKDLRGKGKEAALSTLALLVGAHSPGSPALCSSGPAASLTTCLGIFIAAHRGIAASLECGRSWACGRRQTHGSWPLGGNAGSAAPGLLTGELGQCSSTARGPVWPLHPPVPPP